MLCDYPNLSYHQVPSATVSELGVQCIIVYIYIYDSGPPKHNEFKSTLPAAK